MPGNMRAFNIMRRRAKARHGRRHAALLLMGQGGQNHIPASRD